MATLGVRVPVGYDGHLERVDTALPEGVDPMTLLATAAAVGLWLVAGLVAYVVVAYAALLYLPSADRLPSGAAADAVFVLSLPLVLAVTWLATLRRRG